jgi:hypothetical protein
LTAGWLRFYHARAAHVADFSRAFAPRIHGSEVLMTDQVRMRTPALVLVLIASAALAAAGCTEKLVEPPPPEPVFGVPDSIQEIFTLHCGFDGCHGGATPQQGLALGDARTSWLAIVGVPSTQRPQFLRIEPGDSLDSYVVMKLRNDPRKGGQPMPLGDFPLDSALVMRIATWAQEGAPGQELPVARRGAVAAR